MTVTPEGLTITGPEDVYTHSQVHRFLRGRKQRLYPEVAAATTVHIRDVGFSSCHATWSSTHGVAIEIYLSVKQSQTFRHMPWSAALHEWGHAVSDYHYFRTWTRNWSAYLDRRGLVGWSPTLDKTYVWTIREMIADDYMLCFGNRHLERTSHMNRDLPPLDRMVWRRWFNGTWRGL